MFSDAEDRLIAINERLYEIIGMLDYGEHEAERDELEKELAELNNERARLESEIGTEDLIGMPGYYGGVM